MVVSIAIFSALYAVLRLIQTVSMVGVPEARFSITDAFAPLYGILLGPYVGGLSVILGTFLGIALARWLVP